MNFLEDGKSKEIVKWFELRDLAEEANRNARHQATALLNQEIALGKSLFPKNSAVGDTYNVWMGDDLFRIELKDTSGNGTYSVKLMKNLRNIKV